MSKTLNRREFLRDAAIAGARVGAGALILAALPSSKRPETAHAGGSVERPEPFAGNWKTWVLSSGREIRLPSPAAATSPQGTMGIEQLRRAQLERTEAQINAARFWDAGPATRRWTEMHLDMIKTHKPNPPRASRGLALGAPCYV